MTHPLKGKIPSTGEELLRVGLGTYKAFDVGADKTARAELTRVLQAFVEAGGALIDSSPMYGTAETVAGDLSTQTGLNSKLFVATKVWTTGHDEGIRQMNQSFTRMGRAKSRMDLLQIHNLVDWKTHLATLRKWKEEGRIRYLGITHYTPSAFGEMERILKSEPLDFIQIPYSMAQPQGEKSLIPLAAARGVAVIANEPFDAGALFSAVRGKTLHAWVRDELGIQSWAQFFLKFILSNRDVQFAIPATRKLEHLKDNLAAAFGELPSVQQRERMRREFAAL